MMMILSILDGWMKIFQKYNLVSDKEIGDNEESDCKSGTSDSEQSDGQVAPIISGWCDGKWQIKMWPLGVSQ
jgi:hypothetical protein